MAAAVSVPPAPGAGISSFVRRWRSWSAACADRASPSPRRAPCAITCVCALREMERECFVVMLLDAQNRLLECAALFYGTLTQTSVHPREVVKLALAHNAAGAIFAHNHPSGVAEQSRTDEMITQTLKGALALMDVRVLDHFIVAGAAEPLSFAEKGLI
jgi:DNA repair protein RadC